MLFNVVTTSVFAAVGIAFAALSIQQRLALSRAKHPSLAGHTRIAKRLAQQVPFWEYDPARFFDSDDPPADVSNRRRDAMARLEALFAERFPKSVALTAGIREHIPDLEFTSRYRVPFQYSRFVRERLPFGAFLERSEGVRLIDLDGNHFYDLTGSYGVNVFGYDFYKACIADGAVRAQALGPVLGAYHTAVADNVRRLCKISQLDAVSFHMSGTEAVMQAVRLARYHTGKSHLVRFSGAYHGWWEDVQPGVGNPVQPHETYTLNDMDERTLRVLDRRRDIACVLVNPLQALHPNAAAPSDSTLVDGGAQPRFDRVAYQQWLRRLRAVCDARGIVLIFDEVFVGFRLAPGGAQEYFGVRADMVTYGKTLGGGLPIGVVCGRKALMRRFRDDRPADICFARGTFNAHPYVMTTMQAFLERLETPEIRALYQDLDETWNRRADLLNARFEAMGLPIRVANLSTIWTVYYTTASRYNWMLQYYLRCEGLALSWVGTGRLIFSLNYTEAEFSDVANRFDAAARAMQADGWWWAPPGASSKAIRRQLLREMLAQRLRLQRD